MYWIGSKSAIDAAEAHISAIVIARPAYLDGHLVPNPTERWAIPQQTVNGEWAIPAYPDTPPPEGCAFTDAVTWPETD